MQNIFRVLKIFHTFWRYGLFELLYEHLKPGTLRLIIRPLVFFTSSKLDPRGMRIRLALESLGPIFIKFGQVISTRRDLLPDDIAV